MRIGYSVILIPFVLALSPIGSHAASLQVSPVSIAVQAPAQTATITLHNKGQTPLNAQIRVFRWIESNGAERLEPTQDVVASPPLTSLAPNTDYTVRIVRVTKRPVGIEEAYRLLVDELPEAHTQHSGTITLALRYSIPVFFDSPHASGPAPVWSVEERHGRIYVSATNRGDRHLRISQLTLRDHSGRSISFGNGLTGYLLGRSTMGWMAPGKARPLSINGSVVISAVGDYGPINAVAQAPMAR